MESIKEETGGFNITWVRVMLIATWVFVLFLILFAKIKLNMPNLMAITLIILKLPSIGLAQNYFEGEHYTKATFIADKIDQCTNVVLCGYVFYYYFVLT